jgi:hypothetical protein
MFLGIIKPLLVLNRYLPGYLYFQSRETLVVLKRDIFFCTLQSGRDYNSYSCINTKLIYTLSVRYAGCISW